MEHIALNNGMEISRLSLGSWAFSGAALWGGCDDGEAIKTVHMAIDAGINLFDTAEKYGDGQAELVMGEALKGRRDKVLLATKVFSDHLDHDNLIRCAEASMKRLQTDYLDILQIHWPNADIPTEETFGAFEELKKAGKVRAVSVCNHGLISMQNVADYDVVLNQMAYNLVWRVTEHQFSPLMEEKKIPVWAYSPLAQGLLTGKFRTLEDVPMNRRANRMYDCKWTTCLHTDHGFEEEIFAFLDELRSICDETGLTMSALAFAFLKSKKNVGSLLAGARTTTQLKQNLEAFDAEVPADVIAKLDALSLELKGKMGTNADMWQNGINRHGTEGRMF